MVGAFFCQDDPGKIEGCGSANEGAYVPRVLNIFEQQYPGADILWQMVGVCIQRYTDDGDSPLRRLCGADGTELAISYKPYRMVVVNRRQLFCGYNFDYFVRVAVNDLFDSPIPFDKKCAGFKPSFDCGKAFVPFKGL